MIIGLITGNHPRHYAFCNAVAKERWPHFHILVEREEMIPNPPIDLDIADKLYWFQHFERRAASEKKYFAEDQALKFHTETLKIVPSEINDAKVCEFVQDHYVDAVFILGVPIIRDPLFSLLPDWKINLHMGLIPEYKGSITFFWPFYFMRPWEAGCTYHVIDRLVDTGEILHQRVPDLDRGMGMHDAANRALQQSYDDVGLVLRHTEFAVQHDMKPVPDPTLQTRGKTFRKSDWSPQLLRVNYDMFLDRMIDHYLDGRLPHTRSLKCTRLNEFNRKETFTLDPPGL